MKYSDKYDIPPELALLYDFLNSLDLRHYVEDGAAHAGGDELATAKSLSAWMRARSLTDARHAVTQADHRRALDLRAALRAFVETAPECRATDGGSAENLSASAQKFPLVVNIAGASGPALLPSPGSSPLGRVLAELQALALSGRLDRLKMCASDDCKWAFFDRSKPGNRRWCSSSLCGNRHKTRRYRQRVRDEG